MKLLQYLTIIALGLSPLARAAEGGSGGDKSSSPSPGSGMIFRIEGAYGMLSGKADSSLSGQKLYSVIIGIEESSGDLRFFASAQYDFFSETAVTIGSDSTNLTYTGFKLGAGAAIYLLKGSGLQPFVSGMGTYTRGGIDSSPQTTRLGDFFRSNLFGYEISVGVDFKRSKSSNSRFRLRAAYSLEKGVFSGISDFASSSMKFGAGVGF